MNPGLPEKYREKSEKRRIVECKSCGHMIATWMKIPQCSKCGAYTDEEKGN